MSMAGSGLPGATAGASGDRLAAAGVLMYLTSGNDDEPAVLEVLARPEGEHLEALRGRLFGHQHTSR